MIIKQPKSSFNMSKFTAEQIADLNNKLKTPEEVLKWGLENLHPKLALASSFGAEDVAVIDMLMKINPKARIFTPETPGLAGAARSRPGDPRGGGTRSGAITFPDAK